MRLKNKVALVTGASRGIGRAIALALAKEGADVALNCTASVEAAGKVAQEIKALGRRAVVIQADVSDKSAVEKMVNSVVKQFGKIDILVNNAGVGEPSAVEAVTEAFWDRIINTNLKGTFFCTQIVGKQMIKQRSGNIINIASTSAHAAAPFNVVYGTSKGGVIALTRGLAVEWAQYNIRVNAVSPSLTRTSIMLGPNGEPLDYYKDRWKRVPSKRFNEPEDVANAVLFLASSESDNIYGQTIIIDGGVTALLSNYIFPDEQFKS